MGKSVTLVKYARLRDEAKRLFRGVRGLARAVGVNHSSISKLINGRYGSDEENLKARIEKAVLAKDPDFCVERLWDITTHYAIKFTITQERPVISLKGLDIDSKDLDMDFELIAVFKRRG